jgi:hypothetical protein
MPSRSSDPDDAEMAPTLTDGELPVPSVKATKALPPTATQSAASGQDKALNTTVPGTLTELPAVRVLPWIASGTTMPVELVLSPTATQVLGVGQATPLRSNVPETAIGVDGASLATRTAAPAFELL